MYSTSPSSRIPQRISFEPPRAKAALTFFARMISARYWTKARETPPAPA